METIASRLDACQDQVLDLYERDSDKLEDQIRHWQLLRLESALFYKAREAGLTKVGHQAVPTLCVAKAKACQAIEVQLALQQLLDSPYGKESWTLQDTSREMWDTKPKRCWKKHGHTVEVRYDCEEDKSMHYVLWSSIYAQRCSDNAWDKVAGHVCYEGLYYILEGLKIFYCKFAKDAALYGSTNKWEVHFGGKVIYDSEFDPVSSTVEVPSAAVALFANPDHPDATHPCSSSSRSSTQGQEQEAPVPKRPRSGLGLQLQQPDSTQTAVGAVGRVASPAGPVDGVRKRKHSDPHGHGCQRPNSISDSAPVIHLRGDPNGLKCFRYRLHQSKKSLFDRISSTWRWSSGEGESKAAYITIWYRDTEQRAQFLNVVKIPTNMHAALGYMTVFG
ncbi:E2 [Macaca mulatta papillomavirus 3]|uniref:Regulatory protein E2 n=1 Tax=Macaca mulatta papillomavirus 3 TaxID=2294151 RepID=A0A385AHR9_9PAPI|nr:E2 [Macaca mulatta papillomavirus 3]AXN57290.1 E2 [Macaca mulatta papillomavirus 3]